MKKNLIGLALLAILSSCSSSEQPAPQNEFVPIPLTRSEESIVKANNDFAFGLLKNTTDINKEMPAVVISPFSATTFFGMMANATAGTSKQEILKTFGFDDLNAFNDFSRKMNAQLASIDNSSDIRIGHLVVNGNDYECSASFKELAADYYDADFLNLGDKSNLIEWFTSKAKWTKEFAEQQIYSRMFDPRFTFAETFYFKGKWASKFDKNDKIDFAVSKGESTKVEAMKYNNSFAYAWNTSCQRIDIPFGNGAFKFTVLLPSESSSIDSFVQNFDANQWDALTSAMKETQGQFDGLILPKFKINEQLPLQYSFTAMGIKSIFENGVADFSALTSKEFYIDGITQVCGIAIDEEGGEASNTTHNDIYIAPDKPTAPETLTVNRPFVFILSESSTGAILQAGVIKAL